MSERLADRLRAALDAQGMSTRAFLMEMAKRNVAGSSTGAVYRYLGGETTPTLEFTQEAAALLEVSPAWLAFGVTTEESCSICSMRETKVRRALELLRDL